MSYAIAKKLLLNRDLSVTVKSITITPENEAQIHEELRKQMFQIGVPVKVYTHDGCPSLELLDKRSPAQREGRDGLRMSSASMDRILSAGDGPSPAAVQVTMSYSLSQTN